jgi:hypothetical protein
VKQSIFHNEVTIIAGLIFPLAFATIDLLGKIFKQK